MKRIGFILNLGLTVSISVLVTAVIFLATGAFAKSSNPFTPTDGEPSLHYQGRLLDPATGNPRSDGTYPMVFSLYTVASAGSPLWTETKDVSVSDGIFSTLLGDTNVLNPAIFNGQELWLGITVGADPQMTPRQPLVYVPHAFYALNSDTVDGYHSYQFAQASHSHSTLPIAYGSVRFDGVLGVGSYNVDSVSWNNSLDRYEIDLNGVYYSIDDVTVATVSGSSSSCPGGASARQSSVSGLLLIYVVNQSGVEIQCSFRFVSYAGQ